MLLQDCACGEPLLNDLRKCPKCGTRNPGYKQARWRTFWPDVDSLEGADEAIRLGYWGAFFAAGLGAVTSLIPGVGIGVAGLCDASIYALCGLGILYKWRTAAVIGFLFCVLNISFSLFRGGGVGVLAFFIFIGLLNGIRGTFIHARLSKAPKPAEADRLQQHVVLLFSYGTLQLEDVQLSTFGRRLHGASDELPGFERTRAGEYENARFTGRREDRITGIAFEVTENELAQADAYEDPAFYKRIQATLASGRIAWLYVAES
jgi:hypothetical protein